MTEHTYCSSLPLFEDMGKESGAHAALSNRSGRHTPYIKPEEGLVCTKCGCDTRVVDTRRLTNSVTRLRRCVQCNHAMETEENVVAELAPKVDKTIVLNNHPQ